MEFKVVSRWVDCYVYSGWHMALSFFLVFLNVGFIIIQV